ncbi:MAG: hypothetical protein KBC26_02570, partial [Candidatus Pacebacteria bacterium]|nr:hypothetical protein [Candidatus Paceibacterota bacterium]
MRKFSFQKNISLILIFSFIFQAGFLFAPNHAQAATKSWDFSNSSDYTFDDTKIEFSSGQAQLKVAGSSSWYHSDWNYKRTITINNATSTLTDFQVDVPLDTATLIAANKMNSDCSDIR